MLAASACASAILISPLERPSQRMHTTLNLTGLRKRLCVGEGEDVAKGYILNEQECRTHVLYTAQRGVVLPVRFLLLIKVQVHTHRFNADLGLYMINSHSWTVPRESIHVIHFTLGPIKPWQWWAPWVADESSSWQAVRAQVHCRDAALVRLRMRMHMCMHVHSLHVKAHVSCKSMHVQTHTR